MIQSTPNYVISYKAINKQNEHEEGVFLSPVQDPIETMERDGYRKISTLSTKVNK